MFSCVEPATSQRAVAMLHGSMDPGQCGSATREGTVVYGVYRVYGVLYEPGHYGRAGVPALQLGQPLDHGSVPAAEAACECG